MKIEKRETPRGRVSMVVDESVTIKGDWMTGFAPLDDAWTLHPDEVRSIIVTHDNDELPVLCINSGNDMDRIVPPGDHVLIIKDGSGKETAYDLKHLGKNKLKFDKKEK